MIKTLRTSDIYAYTSTLTALTNLCEVYALKPIEEATPTGSYLYTSIVSDTKDVIGSTGVIVKLARISFTVVCKKDLLATEDEESVLMDIIEVLDQELANEACTKVLMLGSIGCIEIVSDMKSPIMYNEKNRPIVTKDYFIRYFA